MNRANLDCGQHDHSFGQDKKRPGESRTLLVIAITAITMVVEVTAGLFFGSMALLADGLHMASHAAALSIAAFAYIYARRHAHDGRFSFGAGKVNSLGGYTGAVLLAVFSLVMAWESSVRLIAPVDIAFNQAIAVAILGLLVNGVSVFILGHRHAAGTHGHDHNLRAAYFHVLADGLTSLLAIFALLAGKYFGLIWMDPAMGILGAVLVARWSFGLLRNTSSVLLDRQAPTDVRNAIREALEQRGEHSVTDLHVWSIGPGIYSVAAAILADQPEEPDYYKQLLPKDLGLVHVTVEVHKRSGA